VDLRARLDGYEVTALPRRGRLRLVWSLADAEVAGAATDIDAASASRPSARFAILDDYRITRIPTRAAS